MTPSSYDADGQGRFARERERLSLLCHADRIRLRLIVESASRSADRTPASLRYAAEALQAASIMPGRLGRLANRLLFGLQLGKALGLQRWVRF